MAPHLGSTFELILFAGAQVSLACGHESKRVGPSIFLICHGMTWVREI